jgi:hypothetical protein
MRPTRLLATILLASYLPACTSYTLIADPASGLQVSPKPVTAARVTLRSGERIVLKAPWVDGDSLRGASTAGTPRSVALADVGFVEAGRSDGVKTAGLVVGVLAVSFVAVVATYFLFIYDN